MTELVGDPCIPSELIVPIASTTQSSQPQMSGALFLSGSKLYFWLAGDHLITSI